MIETRILGKNGPAVGCLGYGAMGLEGYYGISNDSEGIKTIQHALDVGMTMIDTADAYGNGHNESLVGQAIHGRRSQAFIATKFGIILDDSQKGTPLPTGWGFTLKINGRPSYVRKAVDTSLQRLHTDFIDLLYLHYPDPDVPIEETVDAMSDAVRAGKTRSLGLSNVTSEQVQRASTVHPIAAVQYEYSLWRREAEKDLLPTLRKLEIALVPWSPLGCGFLAGNSIQLEKKDFRRNNPRFAEKNLPENQRHFAPLFAMAKDLGATPAQLALAWLLHQGKDIVPIPGSRHAKHVDENAEASSLSLSLEVLEQINEVASPGLAKGNPLL